MLLHGQGLEGPPASATPEVADVPFQLFMIQFTFSIRVLSKQSLAGLLFLISLHEAQLATKDS